MAWDATWRAAVGNRTRTPVDVLFLGDSITEGYDVAGESHRWAKVALAQLRSTYATSGVAGGAGWIQMSRRNDLTFAQEWTWSGGTGTVPYFGTLTDGLAGWAAGWTSTTADTATTTVSGTSFDLYYSQNPGWGFVDVYVDGSLVESVDCSAGSHVAVAVKHYTFASRGSHTVALTRHSAASISPHGIFVYDQDEAAGIRGWIAGHAGWKSSDFTSTSGSARTNFQAIYNQIKPALVTILLGYNDFNGGMSSATFQANVQAMVDDLKTSTPAPSILLLGMYHTGNPTTDTGLDGYNTAQTSMAAADPNVVGFYNLGSVIGPVSSQPTYFDSGTVHLLNAGGDYLGGQIATQVGSFTDPGTSQTVKKIVLASVDGAATRAWKLV